MNAEDFYRDKWQCLLTEHHAAMKVIDNLLQENDLLREEIDRPRTYFTAGHCLIDPWGNAIQLPVTIQ